MRNRISWWMMLIVVAGGAAFAGQQQVQQDDQTANLPALYELLAKVSERGSKPMWYAIDPASLDVRGARPTDIAHRDRIISPDGERVLSILRIQPNSSNAFLGLSNVRAHVPRQQRITEDIRSYRDIAWLDNQHIVYSIPADGQQHVEILNVDKAAAGEADAARRIDPDHNTFMPRVSSTGMLAWARRGERDGKVTLDDLVIDDPHDDEAPKVLAEDQPIFDVCFSPDGERLACSTVGRIEIFNLKADDSTAVEFRDLDERLYAHIGHDLAWHPNQDVIACRITFAGGRSAGFVEPGEEPEYPVIFGDHEIFFIDTQAKTARWAKIDGPGGAQELTWVQKTSDSE